MMLLVGLGNPGAQYAQTRHNVGFLVIDELARRWDGPCSKRQFKADVGSIRVGSQNAVLCKPQTFMNLSGQAVASLMGYYKVQQDQVVVIHDDVDLDFGDLRLKQGGGHGGHNGLRDLIARTGGPGFTRVRFGVSRPPRGWDTADYVLGKWSADEQAQLSGLVDQAANAVESILRDGVIAAMNTINTRPRPSSVEAETRA